MAIISNKPITVANTELVDAGEDINIGDMLAIANDNKAYKVPNNLASITSTVNIAGNILGSCHMQGNKNMLIIYSNTSHDYLYAKLFSMSENNGIQNDLPTGSQITVYNSSISSYSLYKVNDEYAMCVYSVGNGVSAVPYISLLKVAANTVSMVGSPSAISSTGSQYSSFYPLSNDGTTYRYLAMFTGHDTSKYTYFHIVSVNVVTGSMSVNTALTVGNYTSGNKIILTNNNTQFVFIHNYYSNNYLRATLYTISGSTITATDTKSVSVTSSPNFTSAIKLNDSQILVGYYYSVQYKHRIITYTTTAVTIETEYAVTTSSNQNYSLVDSNHVIMQYYTGSQYCLKVCTITGSVIDVATSTLTLETQGIFKEFYGTRYIVISNVAYTMTVEDTTITLPATTIPSFVFTNNIITPFKHYSITFDGSTPANSKANMYFYNYLDMSGYAASNSSLNKNGIKKVGYISF